MDFNLETYKKLLNTLIDQGFSFIAFQYFVSNPAGKVVVLRHDVDSLPGNSLKFAQIQHESGIQGTYYFRIVPQSFDEKIIREIAELGHEIGYHYEDLSLTAGSMKNEKLKIKNDDECSRILFERGIESFQKNLETLRKIAAVETICMHGNPMGRYDNRDLWEKYDYRDFGIIGEPYFDVDFSQVLYLTDTGRRWNGEKVSIWDKEIYRKVRKPAYAKASAGKGDAEVAKESLSSKYSFKTTFDIIRAAEEGELPDRVMITFHPQRWSDKTLPWVKELVWQRVKNVGKRVLVKFRDWGF